MDKKFLGMVAEERESYNQPNKNRIVQLDRILVTILFRIGSTLLVESVSCHANPLHSTRLDTRDRILLP